MSYIIVGLGNPREQYEGTRHNTGRAVLEHFCAANAFPEWEHNKKLNALVSEGKIKKEAVTCLLPQTFMNKSGVAVKPVVTNKKKAEQLVVVHDDLDLPIGKFRIVFNRGSGGHRGVESIIRALKTERFIRVRVGISPQTPSGKTKKPNGARAVDAFILGMFTPKERVLFKKTTKQIQAALITILSEGKEKAMNVFN